MNEDNYIVLRDPPFWADPVIGWLNQIKHPGKPSTFEIVLAPAWEKRFKVASIFFENDGFEVLQQVARALDANYSDLTFMSQEDLNEEGIKIW